MLRSFRSPPTRYRIMHGAIKVGRRRTAHPTRPPHLVAAFGICTPLQMQIALLQTRNLSAFPSAGRPIVFSRQVAVLTTLDFAYLLGERRDRSYRPFLTKPPLSREWRRTTPVKVCCLLRQETPGMCIPRCMPTLTSGSISARNQPRLDPRGKKFCHVYGIPLCISSMATPLPPPLRSCPARIPTGTTTQRLPIEDHLYQP